MIIKFLGENSNNEPQVAHVTRQLATQELTGETTIDIMSNIYDLEGNNMEWTAQASGPNARTIKGGSFSRVSYSYSYYDEIYDDPTFYSSSFGFGLYSTYYYCDSTSRCTLYL